MALATGGGAGGIGTPRYPARPITRTPGYGGRFPLTATPRYGSGIPNRGITPQGRNVGRFGRTKGRMVRRSSR